MDRFDGAGERVKRLSEKTREVYEVVRDDWPVNPVEVGRQLEGASDTPRLSAKYLYHFRKLEDAGLIRLRKVGNTYVSWPVEIERLRVIQDLMGGG